MPLLKDTLNATLWSVLAEIIAKIISPAVFLILTHILSPSDFGVVSVATTILGLIYVVSDMGTVSYTHLISLAFCAINSHLSAGIFAKLQ